MGDLQKPRVKWLRTKHAGLHTHHYAHVLLIDKYTKCRIWYQVCRKGGRLFWKFYVLFLRTEKHARSKCIISSCLFWLFFDWDSNPVLFYAFIFSFRAFFYLASAWEGLSPSVFDCFSIDSDSSSKNQFRDFFFRRLKQYNLKLVCYFCLAFIIVWTDLTWVWFSKRRKKANTQRKTGMFRKQSKKDVQKIPERWSWAGVFRAGALGW